MERSKRITMFLQAAIALHVLGCAAAGPRLYVNPQADVSYYKKVAVLPFGNLTGERYAGDRITRCFVTELVMADRYQLLDPAEFRAVLDRTGAVAAADGTFDPKKVKDAATELGATGLIRGAVTEYQMQRSGAGDVPVLSFDVEMVDVATGDIVWRGSIARRGKGRAPVFGGSGTRTFGRLTEEACREMVERLVREAF